MLNRHRITILVSLALAVGFGMLLQQVLTGPAEADANRTATAEVRITAQRLEDGRTEFALQQRDHGHWSDRILPSRRFFPAEPAPGRWLNSTPIEVSVPIPADDHGPLMCIIGHGDPHELTWRYIAQYAQLVGGDLGLQVRFSTHPVPQDQAAAIEQCVDDGAKMIAASLGHPQEVVPELQHAAEAGVLISTFHDGAEHADDARSIIHIALDEAAAGRRAGTQFNHIETTGNIICVIPAESTNAHEQRCDGLAETYTGGDILRLNLAGSDAETEMAAFLTSNASSAGGLLTTTPDLLTDALHAIEESGVHLKLGSIGETFLRELSLPQRDQILFSVTDMGRFYTHLTATAMYLIYTYHPNARFFHGAVQLTAEPNLHTGGPLGGRRSATQSHDSHDHGH